MISLSEHNYKKTSTNLPDFPAINVRSVKECFVTGIEFRIGFCRMLGHASDGSDCKINSCKGQN
jgi:hypothetical protein